MKEIKMGDLKIKKILERRKMVKTKMLGEVIMKMNSKTK